LDKHLPDVLRVTRYIIEQSSKKETFSVNSAARSSELNGIGEYRIAEILRSICLEPNGPKSLHQYTTISTNNENSLEGRWELTPEAYFGYLSYQGMMQAEAANRFAGKALLIATASLIVTLVLPIAEELLRHFF
jgi:hypothetical protein